MVFCESKIFRLKTANDRIVKYGSTKTANLLAVLEVAHKIANQKTVKKIDSLRAAATPGSQPFCIAISDESPYTVIVTMIRTKNGFLLIDFRGTAKQHPKSKIVLETTSR